MIRKPGSRPIQLGAATIAVLGVLAPGVSAFASGMECYTAGALWNAPNGSVVASRSDGPITAIITALGESRSHTMLSHGAAEWDGKIGWATHSTARPPGTTGGTSPPIKPRDLSEAQPGMIAINMGGAYAFHQSSQWVRYQWSTTATATQDFNRYRAVGAANWVWLSMPYQDALFFSITGPIRCDPPFCPTPEELRGSVVYINMGFNDAAGFHPFNYGFHQYMSGGNKVAGLEQDSPTDRGIVCSQVPAYALAKWAPSSNPPISLRDDLLAAKRYTKEKTVAAGNALINSVYSECREGIGKWEGTWLDVTSFFGFGPSRATVCDRAAAQVLNCFLNGERSGGCDDTSFSKWDAYVANASADGAFSLSPDGLLGWSGWPSSGRNVGPWAPWSDFPVQWNGGGSYSGCSASGSD